MSADLRALTQWVVPGGYAGHCAGTATTVTMVRLAEVRDLMTTILRRIEAEEAPGQYSYFEGFADGLDRAMRIIEEECA